MKRVLVVLIVIGGLFNVGSAQSGRRAKALPAPPAASTTTASGEDAAGVSDSIPINRKTKTLPNLRGGVIEIPKSKTPTQPATPTASPAPTDAAANGGDDEVIKVETQLVTIPVSVLDRQGNFITGLQQGDFQIFENGAAQEVAYFSTTEQPFTVILMIDVSPSTQFKIDEIHAAAIEFVNELKANDSVMVIAFDQSAKVLTEPTIDRSKIEKAIRRAAFGSGTSIYDAVDNVINKRLGKIEGRKAVVLFSDGVDTTSFRSSYEKSVGASEEADAAFYTIYYNTFRDMGGSGMPTRGSGTSVGDILGGIWGGGGNRGGIGGGQQQPSREDFTRGELYLEELSKKTGGRKYDGSSTQSLQTAFFNIAEELRRQYSLGYYPAEGGQAGQRKTVKVRVERPNLIVRARDSYTVGEQTPSAAPNSK